MGANSHAANAFLDVLRGVDVTAPARWYASLHTAASGDNGANEVSTGAWPSYVRVDPAGGGDVDTGFNAAASKAITNALDMLFARLDAAGPVTCQEVGFWDASTGGNCWFKARFVDSGGNATTKTFYLDDECIIKAGELEIILEDDDPS